MTRESTTLYAAVASSWQATYLQRVDEPKLQREHLKLQRRRARPGDTFVVCVRCVSRSCWRVVLLAANLWFTGDDSPVAITATCTVVCCV